MEAEIQIAEIQVVAANCQYVPNAYADTWGVLSLT
jgi:hypothetical protein